MISRLFMLVVLLSATVVASISYAEKAPRAKAQAAATRAAEELKVVEVSKGGALYQLGLEKGDVVKKVDGAAPISFEYMASKLSDLKYSQKMNIQIVRNGKAQTIEYIAE